MSYIDKDTIEDEYKRKIQDYIKDPSKLDPQSMIDILDDRGIQRQVPYIQPPQVTYGPDEGGGGEGEGGQGQGGGKAGQGGGPVISIAPAEIVKSIEELFEVKFTKGALPEKKERITYSKRGTTMNLDKTLMNALTRSTALDEEFEVKEEDVVYWNYREYTVPKQQSATFITIADRSGSTEVIHQASLYLTFLIAVGLKARYENRVKRIYIVHADDAAEVSEEDFFKTVPSGGTSFGKAYGIVEAIFKGEPYPSLGPANKYVNPLNEDVYILHVTDGENFDYQEAMQNLKNVLSYPITRFVIYNINGYESDFIRNARGKSNLLRIITVPPAQAMERSRVKEVLKTIFD